MNLKPLPLRDRLRPPTAGAHTNPITHAIGEFLVLEACVAQCETMAESISPDELRSELSHDLSECIAACHTYLAAKARESRFEARLRTYCLDALTATADACDLLDGSAAANCRKVIRAGLKLLQHRRDCASLPLN